jgi:Family of unknown function (DUF5996)
MTRSDTWPELDPQRYRETRDTLHMYAQIVGKIQLKLAPPQAQWAHAPLRLSRDGLSTTPLWVGGGTLTVDLDLVHHQARFDHSDGRQLAIPFGISVAEFYDRTMRSLRELGADIEINPMPQEVAEPVRFDQDERSSYDPEQAKAIYEALLRVWTTFERFLTGFGGRQRIGFYWGGFDAGVFRYSGRKATAPEGLPQIMTGALDAESAGVSFGIGPDGANFIAMAYPSPQGWASADIQPKEAQLLPERGMWVLPYQVVRDSADPAGTLLDFVRTSYDAAATGNGWERERLEQQPPRILKKAA